MSETIFTKILNGDIPGEIVYKGKECFAILTIAPHNPGHVLIVSKAQIADWQDLPIETWQEMMHLAQQVGKVIKKLYNPPKVGLSAVGFEVPHVHIHVLSLFDIADLDHDKARQAKMQDLSREATKIRSKLEALGGKK